MGWAAAGGAAVASGALALAHFVADWWVLIPLADGQTIEVIGTKSREPAPDGAALLREPAWSMVITAGELPVLLVP